MELQITASVEDRPSLARG